MKMMMMMIMILGTAVCCENYINEHKQTYPTVNMESSLLELDQTSKISMVSCQISWLISMTKIIYL